MAKKVLFVATVDSHIELFHVPFLKMFHDKGWEVHVATDTNKKIQCCDKKIKLPIKRSPFKLISNYEAVKKLREIVKKERYDIVHCHTPMGGVVARLATKKMRKQGTRVIYTAHGFHFYVGAPMHYWLMFYPVEKYLAKHTDTLITINEEDHQRAKKKFGKRCCDIQYVPGVGVDFRKFKKKMSAEEKSRLRKELGLKNDDKVLICVGRLDANKNQGFLIRVIKDLLEKDSKYQLFLVGPDEINDKYQKLAKKLGVTSHVHFLGFRNDISELMQISDVAVSSSKREGLPVNLIEASMLGLPIVATDCRGNRDVCQSARGLSSPQGDLLKFCQNVLKAMKIKYPAKCPGKYGIENISEEMAKIYQDKRPSLGNCEFPIDFVVLWVDGADSRWLAKKKMYSSEVEITDVASRYRDWGTFKYWFRAVEKYAPWVNHIYLVTDDQKPEWLDVNHPKLTIVDHKDIMDAKYLPTFNSQAIEMNLHKIPGLSEHFVYFNDDMFLNNPVRPKDFFKHGLPVELANINAATGMIGDQIFAQTMFNDALLINRNFDKKKVVHRHLFKWTNFKYGSFNIRTLSQMIYPYFTGFKAHHMPTPLLKKTFNEVWEQEGVVLRNTCSHKFRHPEDVNQYIFLQWQLCKNQFVPRRASSGKHIKFKDEHSVDEARRILRSRRVKYCCINDNLSVNINDQTFAKIMERLLSVFESKFSESSRYEK